MFVGVEFLILKSRRPASSILPSSICFLRVGGPAIRLEALRLDDPLDRALELVVLVRADRRRAGDDERRARLVDQDAVDLIDDGVGMAALHLLGLGRGHAVVAQVIEAHLRSSCRR